MNHQEPSEQSIKAARVNSTQKWFDNPLLADYLLFFIPPLGIYCLLKSKKIVSKPVRMAVGVMTFAGLLWIMAGLI